MKKIMKSSTIKTVVVRLSVDSVSEHDIDTTIFDDCFLEAATRAVESVKSLTHAPVRVVTECWDKNAPKKVHLYNSYWILVNASCYAKAELLRDKFKMQTNLDLSKEPLYGRNIKPKS